MPLCHGKYSCGKVKPLSEFYLTNSTDDQPRMPCKACRKRLREDRQQEDASLSATLTAIGDVRVTIRLSDTDLDLY